MSEMKTHYESNDGSTTDATIAHYGVKGMRWGVRSKRVTSGVKRAVKGQIAKEKAAIRGLNEGDNVMGIPTTKAQAKKNWRANTKADSEVFRKLGLNRIADNVENTPPGGYEVAAARKVAGGLKKTAKRAGTWAKENPGDAVSIAIPVALAIGIAATPDSTGAFGGRSAHQMARQTGMMREENRAAAELMKQKPIYL